MQELVEAEVFQEVEEVGHETFLVVSEVEWEE